MKLVPAYFERKYTAHIWSCLLPDISTDARRRCLSVLAVTTHDHGLSRLLRLSARDGRTWHVEQQAGTSRDASLYLCVLATAVRPLRCGSDRQIAFRPLLL